MQSLPLPDAGSAILIAAGAVCCLAGVGMLVSRAARVAAGPLMLAVGAGLVGLGWPPGRPPAEPAAAPPPVELSPGPVSLSADGLRTVAVPAAPEPPPPLPGREAVRIDIEASEIEPNDTIAGANAAGLGTAISGDLTAGDLDYFALDMPAGTRGDLVAGLVVLTGDAGLSIFDEAGRPLGSADTNAQLGVRTTMLERLIDGPRYYVLVRGVPTGAAATYRLTVATRRR